jgi:hypothetical protein
MALEVELDFFEIHRAEWCREHNGKFAVVQDETLLGFFGEFETAFKAGVNAFGGGRNFLVKQVFSVDPIYFVPG